MLVTPIIYFGDTHILACDTRCNKAWGVERPRKQLSDNPDDYVLLADGELDDAPLDNGCYEGDHAKPPSPVHNKWCARQCERSVIVEKVEDIRLPDFTKRRFNLKSREKEGVMPLNIHNFDIHKTQEQILRNLTKRGGSISNATAKINQLTAQYNAAIAAGDTKLAQQIGLQLQGMEMLLDELTRAADDLTGAGS